MDIKEWLTKESQALGFELCRVTSADSMSEKYAISLEAWLADGHHAGMDWMETHKDRRASPKTLWPEARSIIMLGMNYGPETDPLETLGMPCNGTISVYARGRDYHDVIKGKLKQIAQKLATRADCQVKVFVDTAPVMEKPLAEAAGLGWQGKHTVLVSRDLGNWLFLGAIFTTLEITADPPETDHCGSCKRCLTACPTGAFPAPYVLDSRRCISYLTIEHKGPIDRDLRPLMGNRIYGCDDCLAVCPWNKFAEAGREAKLFARDDLNAPRLENLLILDDRAFRTKFAGSPIKRTGRNRFIRNVLIAAGNSGSVAMLDSILPHLEDPDPIVRGAAIWAIGRLAPEKAKAMSIAALSQEKDASVIAEWQFATGTPES